MSFINSKEISIAYLLFLVILDTCVIISRMKGNTVLDVVVGINFAILVSLLIFNYLDHIPKEKNRKATSALDEFLEKADMPQE